MYFVTDEPKLFNVETGTLFHILRYKSLDVSTVHICNATGWPGVGLVTGTAKECEDFIYSMAGYVGAVNPMAKVDVP